MGLGAPRSPACLVALPGKSDQEISPVISLCHPAWPETQWWQGQAFGDFQGQPRVKWAQSRGVSLWCGELETCSPAGLPYRGHYCNNPYTYSSWNFFRKVVLHWISVPTQFMSPRTSECDLIRNSLCRCISYVNWGHNGLMWVPLQWPVSSKEEKTDIDTQERR